MPVRLPGRWMQFLQELDYALPSQVELHCLGGFVLAAGFGLERPTGDLDFISVVPSEHVEILQSLAGRDSKLATKHGLYVHYVTVADYPENY